MTDITYRQVKRSQEGRRVADLRDSAALLFFFYPFYLVFLNQWADTTDHPEVLVPTISKPGLSAMHCTSQSYVGYIPDEQLVNAI